MSEETSNDDSTTNDTQTSPAPEPTPAEPTSTEPASLLDSQSAPEWTDHEPTAIAEFFPEDVRESVSEESSQAFAEVLNEHKIGAEGATALASLFTQQQQAWQEAAVVQFNEEQTAQQEAVRQDPEIGGDHLQESLTSARTVLESYGSDDLLEKVNVTGLGNNVEFIKFLVAVSKAVPGEPAPPPNGAPTQAPRSLAERLIGTPPAQE